MMIPKSDYPSGVSKEEEEEEEEEKEEENEDEEEEEEEEEGGLRSSLRGSYVSRVVSKAESPPPINIIVHQHHDDKDGQKFPPRKGRVPKRSPFSRLLLQK